MRWKKVWEKWWKWAVTVAIITALPILAGALAEARSVTEIHWLQLLDRMVLAVFQGVAAGTWAAVNNYRKHRLARAG